MGTTQNNLYYSLSEVVRLTGLSHPRVHQLAQNGYLKRVIPPGNKKRGVYTRDSVEKYLRELEAFNSSVPA